MSTVSNIRDVKIAIVELERKIQQQQLSYYTIINSLVKMRQIFRLNKQYELADAIRNLLEDAGIEIIQGTIGYKYNEIPQNLKGRSIDDTWKSKPTN